MPKGRKASILFAAVLTFAGTASLAPQIRPRANRLIHEKSPYLLQHAYNPVDWYPWGDAAFDKAKKENKPIFLSIGYSTCHWCHVMERESFSSPELAAVMNRHFVSIKVDREERPDIDRIYMSFVQATTGGGGWPMSVFLTPDRKPFFGGTYFPPEDRFGRPGFRTVLLRIAEAWEKDRDKIARSADDVTKKLAALAKPEPVSVAAPQKAVLDKAYQQLRSSYDRGNGGFGGAPKFPRPVIFNFLTRYWARTGEKPALDMTLETLRAMARGGIHDHLGGGFHRYSTDNVWFVPHFEKMLYDQAQLATAYADAYQITHDPFFATVTRDILDYVLRDMRAPEGGFYSAEDADSLVEKGKPEHAEGAFYVWEAGEIERALGPERAAIFRFDYGVEKHGNVPGRQDPQGELKGKNILAARHTPAETAAKFGKKEGEVARILAESRQKLFAARSLKPRPSRDDKVLTAWNGLMISALSRAAQALEETRYAEAAVQAAAMVRSKLFDPVSGKLRRRYRAGHTSSDGFLDDYAFLIQGLLDLYETTFNVAWLSWAIALEEKQDALFWDAKEGGYFDTTGGDSTVLFRTRDDSDGAEPAASSIAAMNLLRLWQVTDRKEWRDKADRTFQIFAERLEAAPHALPQLAVALDFSLSKPRQVVIAGEPGAPDTREMLGVVRRRFLPSKVLFLADGTAGQKQLAKWLPFFNSVSRKDGRATAYVCENYVCKLPTTDARIFERQLTETPAQKP
jgi:uncharacterized protein YyaL (SSP411 family)